MTGVTVGILCCGSSVARWRAVASGLHPFGTLVLAVETAETTLLGVVTVATAAGVLGVRRAPPAMTVESRRRPIPGMTVATTPSVVPAACLRSWWVVQLAPRRNMSSITGADEMTVGGRDVPPELPCENKRGPHSTCSSYASGPQASRRLSENFLACCSITSTLLSSRPHTLHAHIIPLFCGGGHRMCWACLVGPFYLCPRKGICRSPG